MFVACAKFEIKFFKKKMGEPLTTKLKWYAGLTITASVLYLLLSGFFLWQLIVGIQEGSAWGIGANVLMIVALFFVGIVGVLGVVRRAGLVLATFAMCCIIVFLFALVELVMTIYGTFMCDNNTSNAPNAIWDFLCENTSWVLIIPLSILLGLAVVGGIFATLFKQGTKENEATGGKDNFYH